MFELITGNRESIMSFGSCLCRKQPSEDPTDRVQTLHGVADDRGDFTDGCVDTTALSHNVHMQLLVLNLQAVDVAGHLAIHTLGHIWSSKKRKSIKYRVNCT